MDVRRIRRLAQRLGARDSDVIRFAIKSMFAKLGPLVDQESRGRNLVPAFLESGPEAIRFFELDATRLDAIINDGVDSAHRVSVDDIALIALMGSHSSYAAMRLGEILESPPAAAADPRLNATVRQYLYEKYVYRSLATHDEIDRSLRERPNKREANGAAHD